MRGLKQSIISSHDQVDIVAPYIGAWIETMRTLCDSGVLYVAPYIGAWIETYNHPEIEQEINESHLI